LPKRASSKRGAAAASASVGGGAALALLRSSAPKFAALGDTTRLVLVERLSTQGPLSITELTQGSRVTRQAITKHLHVLSDAGLVRGTRAGRETLWELTPDQLRDAQHFLDALSARWDDALLRLKERVER
jgi:DNA-binding transcriptional ArsR family regulator